MIFLFHVYITPSLSGYHLAFIYHRLFHCMVLVKGLPRASHKSSSYTSQKFIRILRRTMSPERKGNVVINVVNFSGLGVGFTTHPPPKGDTKKGLFVFRVKKKNFSWSAVLLVPFFFFSNRIKKIIYYVFLFSLCQL